MHYGVAHQVRIEVHALQWFPLDITFDFIRNGKLMIHVAPCRKGISTVAPAAGAV